jgi:hypothetical protein
LKPRPRNQKTAFLDSRSHHAEFKRMALQQEAFNALARAQRELLASRSDYPNAIKQAERAIAAMQALALVIEGSAA